MSAANGTNGRVKLKQGATKSVPPLPRYQSKLAPLIEAFVDNYSQEISARDRHEYREYASAARENPYVKAAMMATSVIAQSFLGEYKYTEDRIQDFVNKNFEQMRGSFAESVGVAFCSAKIIGCSASELWFSPQGKKWMLGGIQILDPERWNFRGKLGEIEDVYYRSGTIFGPTNTTDISIPYRQILHIVNMPEMAFGDPYGVADMRAVIAAVKAWDLIMAELAISGAHLANGILVAEYDPEAGLIQRINADGEFILDGDDNPLMIDQAGVLAQALASLDSSNYAVLPKGADIKNVMLDNGVDTLLQSLEYLGKLIFTGLLFPETALNVVSGTGDSGLNEGHTSFLRAHVKSLMQQVKDKVIEQVIKPLIIWNFGPQDDYGYFTDPDEEKTDKLQLFDKILSGFRERIFPFEDEEAINLARELVGLSPMDLEQLRQAQQGESEEDGTEEPPQDEQPPPDSTTEEETPLPAADVGSQDIEQTLIELINGTYTDGVESIESYEEQEDGTITGVALDEIGLNTFKRVGFTISDENVELKILNADEVENFSLTQSVDYWLNESFVADDEIGALLGQILDIGYPDGIDSVLLWELDGDKFTGVARDVVGVAAHIDLDFQISPKGFVTSVRNLAEVANLSDERFAARRATKQRNCTPGKSFACGNSCQPLKNRNGTPRKCRLGMTDEQLRLHKKALAIARKQTAQGKVEPAVDASAAKKPISVVKVPEKEKSTPQAKLHSNHLVQMDRNFIGDFYIEDGDLDKFLDSLGTTKESKELIEGMKTLVNAYSVRLGVLPTASTPRERDTLASQINMSPKDAQVALSSHGVEGFASWANNYIIVKERGGYFTPNAETLRKTVEETLGLAESTKPAWTFASRAKESPGDEDEMNSNHFAMTYLHEMGHQVLFKARLKVLKAPSSMADETDPLPGKPPTMYSTASVHEWFAESFAAAVVNPTAYKKFDPKGFEVIKNILSISLKEQNKLAVADFDSVF